MQKRHAKKRGMQKKRHAKEACKKKEACKRGMQKKYSKAAVLVCGAKKAPYNAETFVTDASTAVPETSAGRGNCQLVPSCGTSV